MRTFYLLKRNKQTNKQTNKSLLVFTFIFAFLSVNVLNAQVITRVLSSNDEIENHIPWYFSDESTSKEAPIVDVESVLLNDEINGRELPRLGIKQAISFSTSDGTFYDFNDYKVWKFTLKSFKAKSMSIRLENTSLPTGSKMFIINAETKFILGPISDKDLQSGTFRSDYLNGDKMVINVFLPYQSAENFTINLVSYDYGIISTKSYDGQFESSGSCNINVACAEGDGWENEIQAVSKILRADMGICTATLANSECQGFSPYLLTANHCLSGESDISDLIFRFNYQSPECIPNTEAHPSQWQVYFGAQLRASWNRATGSDFALLELTSNLSGNHFFAGWDRNITSTTNTVGIHHPMGDVKKISLDDDSPQNLGNYHGVIWDAGTTEPASSGSALFDANHLIIGQLWGGAASCSNLNGQDQYGRFDISWDGNNTNTSRLSNWLGGNTNPQQLAGENNSISGDHILCTTPKTYALRSLFPGRSISWSVSPANLFGSSTTGTGTSTTLFATSTAQGTATLTFTLTSPNCPPATIQKDIWIGSPDFVLFADSPLCPHDFGIAFVEPIGGFGSPTTYQWTIDGEVYSLGNSTTGFAKYRANNEGYGHVCVTVSNECGSTEKCKLIRVEDCGFGGGKKQSSLANYKTPKGVSEIISFKQESTSYLGDFQVFPNPTAGIFTMMLATNFKNLASPTLQIFNTDGKLIYESLRLTTTMQIDISNSPPGVYYIKVSNAHKTFIKKVILL